VRNHGLTEQGRKEFVAIEDGYRESEQSWTELLVRVKAQGLIHSPKLAVGDGALGFWKSLRKVFPQTMHHLDGCQRVIMQIWRIPRHEDSKRFMFMNILILQVYFY